MQSDDHNKNSGGQKDSPASKEPPPPIAGNGTQHRSVNNLSGGRYELEEFVSKGGMGVVYRARDAELGRDVAVKFLLDVTRDDAKKNALVEARTLAALNHPNIMKIYDVVTSDEQVWIVTEWLRGQSLSEQKLPLPPTVILAVMAQVYDALDAAHSADVIHRDIKPANVMINEDGRVILIDFGVAFAPGFSTGQTMVGSMRYTDPRILEGLPPDAHSDLFAAGLLQLQLMTGQFVAPDIAPLPLYRFMRKSLASRVNQLTDGTYPPLADLARRILLRPGGAIDKTLSAKQAAAQAKKLLLKLTGSSPQEYLARTLCTGHLIDHNAEILMIKEVNKAIRSKNLSPKQKAAWLAYYSAFEHQDEFEGPDDSGPLPGQYQTRAPFLRLAALGLLALFATFLADKELRFTEQFYNESWAISDWYAGLFTPQPQPQQSTPVESPAATKVEPKPVELQQKTVATTEQKQPKVQAKINHPEPTAPDPTETQAQHPIFGPEYQEPRALPEQLPKQDPLPPVETFTSNNAPVTKTPVDADETTAIYLEANMASDVYVDDQYFGRLPNPDPYPFKPGKYQVRLENPYSKPLTTTIEVKAGEPLKYKFRLVPMTTKRTVVLKEPGHLFINGTDYGVVKEQTLNVPFGELDIWIKRDDEIKNPKIAISPGGPERLSLE